MEPIIIEDAMEDMPMRKTIKCAHSGLLDNIVRIFPLPPTAWDNAGLIRLVTETNFPIYNYMSSTNRKENIYPLSSFGRFSTHWKTCIHQTFADQSEIFMFL
jgi:hypothetical protein